MTAEDVEHTVLMLQGRRPAAVVRAESAAHAAQSPFASAAGHHGRLYGMPEVCVLCPRQLAEKERYKVIVNLRNGAQPIRFVALLVVVAVLLDVGNEERFDSNLRSVVGCAHLSE